MNSSSGVKWNLDFLFKGPEDEKIFTKITEIENNVSNFVEQYKGKIKNPEITAEELLAAIKKSEGISNEMIKVSAYPKLLFSADTNDEIAKNLVSQVDSKLVNIRNQLVFFSIEINKLEDNKFNELLENELLANYKHFLEVIRLRKPHQLDEKVEQIINEKDIAGRSAFVNLYTEYTSSFKFPMPDGNILAPAEIYSLITDPDPKKRKDALQTYYRVYSENKIVITSIYNNIIKDHTMDIKRRNYTDAIAPRHLGNQITHDIVNVMMNTVKKNYNILQDYLKLKAKLLYSKDKLLSSDLYAPLTKSPKKYTWEEAKEFVTVAYSEFDKEIGEYSHRFFDENLIDAEIRKTKRGGAFCAGLSPDTKPVILISFKEKIDDISTLAHEMGHGIHDFLAGKNQTYFNYHPPLVLAETASVFGEMIIMDKLLMELEDDEEAKMQLLAKQIEDAIGTIYRQVMYTFFELDAHKIGAGSRLSADQLCELWQDKVEECYDDSVEWLPEHKWNWSTIPHFQHTPFYCYSYAYAMLFVFGLYRQYQKEGKEFIPKFKGILEAGSSEFPQEVAKKVGIDVTTEEFWQGGFDYIKELLEKLKDIVD